MYTVDEIKDSMSHHSLWDIEFKKKDGTLRKMIATRDWKFLEENADELDYKKPTNPANYDCEARNMVRVWDCDELSWKTIPAGERLLKFERIN